MTEHHARGVTLHEQVRAITIIISRAPSSALIYAIQGRPIPVCLPANCMSAPTITDGQNKAKHGCEITFARCSRNDAVGSVSIR